MILLVDNYDSFTYNLVQRLGEIDPDVDLKVVRNDQFTIEQIEQAKPSHLIISPGPCTPVQAGISNDVVTRFAPRIPLLGVCLGHQCIGHALGAKVVRADRIMHGKTSMIHHDGKGIYQGIPNPFEATRYHSLVILPGKPPRRPRSRRLDRPKRNHGSPTQKIPARRRSVSPRKLPDLGRNQPSQEFPKPSQQKLRFSVILIILILVLVLVSSNRRAVYSPNHAPNTRSTRSRSQAFLFSSLNYCPIRRILRQSSR